MSLIKKSFQESFSIIKKNKKIFFLLFLLQIISISIISIININYQSKMLESTQAIMEYIDKLEFDETSFALDILQQKSPLGPDPLLISRNFEIIINNLKFLLIYSLLVFILLNGFIWFLTGNLINKKFLKINKLAKNFLIYILKFTIVTLIFSLLIYLFGYSTLISYLDPLSTETANYIPLLIITLVLFYFIYIAFSLLNKTKLKNILKSLFKIGVKKAHIVLLTYFIIISIISIFSLLIFYLIERNLFLLFISSILTISTIIWARIFLILVIEKLS